MTISSFCRDQLLAHGPLPLPVLADRAAQAGVTTAQDPLASVRSAIAYKEVLLADGRWATPLWLLEGRILTTSSLPLGGWTHLVTEDAYDDWSLPLAEDRPEDAQHDLALLEAALRSAPLPLAAGGVLRRTAYGSGWRAPKDWPGVGLGRHELLGLRVREGQLHLELVRMTPELRTAGEQLACELERLDPNGHGWWGTDLRVSQDLTDALWNRMAADPTFLTSPVPPLSQCIPPLAVAIRSERARRAAEASRWRPQLDLPAALQDVAVQGAWESDKLLNEWLNALVADRLRELREDADSCGEVLPLRGRCWT